MDTLEFILHFYPIDSCIWSFRKITAIYLLPILMKKLILNILFLFIPLVVFILIFPINRRVLYRGLKDDCCNRAIWVHDRIFENQNPIDIAFLGSSHTVNGINDQLIQEKLNAKVTNLGYCRLGENLTYILLKEILKTKKLKKLVVEVREDEDRYSHPAFPYLAESQDVFLPYPLFDRDIFSDIYHHIYYRIEVIKNLLFGTLENANLNNNDFGLSVSTDTASAELLNKAKMERSVKKPELSSMARTFYMKFPRAYLSKIHWICKTNNIQLFFLYLPAYGSNHSTPKEYETYLQYGKVILPPNEIFEKPTNWHDENHLNIGGANQLSNWVADEIQKLNK